MSRFVSHNDSRLCADPRSVSSTGRYSAIHIVAGPMEALHYE